MKKNLILILSMLLVLSMFISIFYAALPKNKDKETKITYAEVRAVKQNLRINISSEPLSLHPGSKLDKTSGAVLTQLFEGLTRTDMWGQTVNGAAKVVKISKDQKIYTFTLRDNKWSNGDPVIAKDFVDAWEWVLNPVNHSVNANQLFCIQGAQEFNQGKISANQVGVKALDDKTLEVKLVSPIPNFLQLIALPTYFPINSKVSENKPNWANEAIDYTTNGPFEISQWLHNQKIVLKKNDQYWDANSVNLSKITMFMISDPHEELSMFTKGQLDWAGSPTGYLPSDAKQVLSKKKSINSQPATGYFGYKFNTTVKPFDNGNIRKAFALAINRQELIADIGIMGVKPAMAIIPPNLALENKNEYFNDNDVANAQKYLQKGLEESGYHNVSDLPPITLGFTSDEVHKKIAQDIQKMWKENLGVNVKLNDSNKQNNSDIFDYQTPQIGLSGDINDPSYFLENANSEDKAAGESKKLSSILNQAQNESDPNKRLKLQKKAEAELMQEMQVIPIYYYSNYWVQNKKLQNVGLTGMDMIQLKWAYFIQ